MKLLIYHIIFLATCSTASAQTKMLTDNAAAVLHASAKLNDKGILECKADKVPAKATVTVYGSAIVNIYDWNISPQQYSFTKTFDQISNKDFTLDISAAQLQQCTEISIKLFYNNIPSTIVLRNPDVKEAYMIRQHKKIDKAAFENHLREQAKLAAARKAVWENATQYFYVSVKRGDDIHHRSVISIYHYGRQPAPIRAAFEDKTPLELIRISDSMVNAVTPLKSNGSINKQAVVDEQIRNYAVTISNTNAAAKASLFAPVLYLVYAMQENASPKLHYITAAEWSSDKRITDLLDKLFKAPNIF